MNAVNKNKQGNFGFPGAYILSIVLGVAMFTLGVQCRGLVANGKILTFLFLAMLLLCMIGSPLVAQLHRKRLNARSVRESNSDADERLARMAADPQREWKKLRRLCLLGYGYVLLLWLLCLLVPFFYGTSGLGTEWILLDLIPAFFLSGLVGKLLRPKEEENISEPLPEERFPRLYALVRQTAGDKLQGKKLSVRVLHGIPDEECNAALAVMKKEITLWIGAVLLCVLDAGELKQVLLHEFAHMDKADVSQSRLYNRIMGYLQADSRSLFGIMTELAISYPAVRLVQEGSLYFLFSSRAKEGRADHFAASQGDREKQSSALAKISAHTLYIYEREPYENLFFSEQIPQHLLTDRARAFREALTQRAQDWKSILERELPSRVDTHPTFRQRWEALGCCDYVLTPAQTDSEFAQECWAAAETADAERASITLEHYESMRKEGYLDDLAVVEAFESGDGNLAPEELRGPMLAYYKIGRPEKMEEICDRILAETDNPFSTAFSNYWKGILLLHRYDRAGLDHLYRAMEANSNYIREGLHQIGRFCTLMGLQKELDEYRSRAPELMQLKEDRSVGGIHAKAKLEPASLPEGWLEKILEFIRSAGGQDMQAVYLVRECAKDDYKPSSFVLRFRENTPEERIDQVYDRVFSLLDDWPEDYEFALYVFENSMEKPLSRVPGSCVYTAE